MSNVYTLAQRQQIRKYFCLSIYAASSNPLMEGAMNTIQGLADPSPFNDSITIINNLALIDQQRFNITFAGIASVSSTGSRISVTRNVEQLKDMGRELIRQLASIFSMYPVGDYYGDSPINSSGTIELAPFAKGDGSN